MQSTAVHCFCQCGCEPELHIEANLDSSIEEEKDAFQEGCIWPVAEKDVGLSFHISVDNELATLGIFSIDELC